jgi:hypothetical protein
MRIGRGLAGAAIVLVVFAAGYLVGRGQRPRVRMALDLPAGTTFVSPPVELPVFGPEQVPAFGDTMKQLLADLDRRIAARRADSGPGPVGLEHVYSYYGRFCDALRRLQHLSDPDSMPEARRQVVMNYRAALKALQSAAGD